jgi:glycosyltransferase involved in cell wall biosynthesis
MWDPYFMKGKRIILTVSNDLVIDQRVDRTARTLEKEGSLPLLVGRKLPGSQPVNDRSYPVRRLRLLFNKGPLFYACFNVRLFFFLIFRKPDLMVSNDLDTLPACYLASRLINKPLVYDSHEFFTEVPELEGRAFTKKIWTGIEKRILPRLSYTSTVSLTIAEAYADRYGIDMKVIRNLPYGDKKEAKRPDLLQCGPKRIIIYQGALNIGRGLENMISAMKYLDAFQLHIFGDGDIAGRLLALCKELQLEGRVEFRGRLPFRELKPYTRQASLGISLEEDMGLNYRYALPNKLFDYIQAGIPVLVSALPEMQSIIEEYQIGQVLKERDPEKLALQVNEMMGSEELRMQWKKNLRKAAAELCWEKEEEKLVELYGQALSP